MIDPSERGRPWPSDLSTPRCRRRRRPWPTRWSRCRRRCSDLGATIETEAGKGFKGQAAAGFGEAVNEWFDVAITLGPILEGYSQNLMYVAQEHATNDVDPGRPGRPAGRPPRRWSPMSDARTRRPPGLPLDAGDRPRRRHDRRSPTQIDDLLEQVESLTPGWDESSESHAAHLEHQQRLRDGVKRLTEALDQVRSKVATYREDAREIEVENVAIVN